jgi:outer membrane protein assembly factor BamB
MNARFRVLVFLGVVAVVLAAHLSFAEEKASPGDWPGWRGPDRTGLSKETGLLQKWPENGPRLAWKITGLGGGYSTPSLAGGRIYLMGMKDKSSEYVFCLDANGGKEVWAKEVGRSGRSYPGPRSTPTVANGQVYAISSDGQLVCLKSDNGDLVWKKDLMNDYGGRHGMWNYAESPLVDGDAVLCTPGGSKATLVLLKCKDGKEVWRSPITGLKPPASKFGGGKFGGGKFGGGKGGKGGKGGFGMGKKEYNEAGYASAIAVEFGGVKQYVQYLAGGVVGIAAKDGKLLWHYDDIGGGNAVAITPLFREGSVFASTTYGVGAGKATIKKHDDGTFKAESNFAVRNLDTHHGGMVLVGDHVYGTTNGGLMCVSFKDGKVAWQTRGVGKGSVTYADGHIYHRGENGGVALVEATPTGYKQKGRFTQPERSSQKAWPHPVIAGGKLYLRDWDALFCYEIKGN